MLSIFYSRLLLGLSLLLAPVLLFADDPLKPVVPLQSFQAVKNGAANSAAQNPLDAEMNKVKAIMEAAKRTQTGAANSATVTPTAAVPVASVNANPTVYLPVNPLQDFQRQMNTKINELNQKNQALEQEVQNLIK